MSKQNAVMALSGGMDSSSLLFHLLHRDYNVTCLSFDYGQKHHVELDRAASLVEYLSTHGHEVNHKLVDLKSAFSLFESDLLVNGGDVPEGHYEEESMKATVVPNRNAIFASLLYGTALSLSEKTGKSSVVALGVHSGDHAIYPDCRPEFYNALDHAFTIGNWGSDAIDFYLPYLELDKSGILSDAETAIGALKLDFEQVFSDGVDAILTPSTPSAAFGLGEMAALDPVKMYLFDVFTVTVNLAGLPGISIPAGLDSKGLPLGLQLIGRPWEEGDLLNTAFTLENALDFNAKPNKWWI